MFRTLGYVLGSTDHRGVVSAELQKKAIEEHCRLHALQLDGVYIDRAASGDQPLEDREAGGRRFSHAPWRSHCRRQR